MDTIQQIKSIISKCINVEESLIVFEIPKDNKLGDYSTNTALRFAKQLGKKPFDLANEIKEYVLNNVSGIKDIQIAGPGFINFFLDEASISGVINTILEKQDKYGYNDSGNKEKILVEYVSANPTGDLHVGHAKAAAWGDSVTRLLRMSNYDCLREYYINDAGQQITNLANSILARYSQKCGIEMEMPIDGYHGKDIIDIANELYEQNGNKLLDLSDDEKLKYFKRLGLNKELEKIRKILDEFGVEFDVWSSEQVIRDSGKLDEVLNILKSKGLTYEQEGALWFKSTDFGDDKDRVLVKSDGLYTYLTPDIAYHANKLERGYTHLVDILGADHHGYIARMKAALNALGYSKDCLEVDIIQMIRLIENGEEVKMSKRTGKAVTIKDLIDDIGVDATRYFLCSRASDSHLDFDLTLAKTQSNENPVYYAQYAHARICSILKNAPKFEKLDNYELLKDPKEIDLLKLLKEFPNEVGLSAKTRSPNKICNYIQKLAGCFHSFYGAIKVIDPEQKELTNQRIGLLEATKIVLKNALWIIGVSAPIHM